MYYIPPTTDYSTESISETTSESSSSTTAESSSETASHLSSLARHDSTRGYTSQTSAMSSASNSQGTTSASTLGVVGPPTPTPQPTVKGSCSDHGFDCLPTNEVAAGAEVSVLLITSVTIVGLAPEVLATPLGWGLIGGDFEVTQYVFGDAPNANPSDAAGEFVTGFLKGVGDYFGGF